MRIDEMILKANKDGKTYENNGYVVSATYCSQSGFIYDGKPWDDSMAFLDGWEEKPKRHLTVSEAEKELDCVIDALDISKLLRPMSEVPDNNRNVIVLRNYEGSNDACTVFYDYFSESWRWCDVQHNNPAIINIQSCSCWNDPAELIKLLPKE